MNIFSKFLKQEVKIIKSQDNMINGFKFKKFELPTISETGSKDYIEYGKGHSFFKELIAYYDKSPIHQAIIVSKSKMVAGGGFDYDENRLQSENDKILFNQFLNFADGKKSLQEVVDDISLDYQIFGHIALEVFWNYDFSKIVKIKRLDVSKIAVGKKFNEDDEVVEYYYSKDFAKKDQTRRIAAFDIKNKEDYNQLIFVKNEKPGLEYYGAPYYYPCLKWVHIDSLIADYHSSNLENSFQPSFFLKFYKKPANRTEREEVLDNIQKTYGGVANTGKIMVSFSDGKEYAPDLQPVEVSNIDKQLIIIAEQADAKILSGHRMPPELANVKTKGQLGNSDLDVQYKIFNSTVIVPDQMVIEKLLNKILKVNNLDVNLKIVNLNPLA
jgi:hypothetical protein